MKYSELEDLPKINGVDVIGDKNIEDYGIEPMTSEEMNELMLEVFGFIL